MPKVLQSWPMMFLTSIFLAVMALGNLFLLTAALYKARPQLPPSSSVQNVMAASNLIPAQRSPTFAPSPTIPTATITNTPFQPISPTRTPTITQTPTNTPTTTSTYTATPTITFTSTFAPTWTNTIIPTETVKPPQAQVLVSTFTPQPLPSTFTPVPLLPKEETTLPSKAHIDGLVGHPMLFSLDCEARSAVDIAGYFGVSIDEVDFLNRIPYTDDPETGYVGSYRDPAGSVPPNSYGVHAGPVADVLKSYGVNAHARKNMSLDELKREIADGRPVIAWVVGSVQPGWPISYTAPSTGNTTVVAPYEHTVIVVGYDQYYLTIQDTWKVYQRTYDQFTTSWSVLGNMAITIK